MKVALVHDWLNDKYGGAENVLEALTEIYPDAPIYTLLHNVNTTNTHIDTKRIHTSYLQKFPGFLRSRSRYLLPFIPSAIEQWDFSEYDVVISSSSAWVKGIITKPSTLHICYCHTPMRFVWDYWPRYVDEQKVGILKRIAIHLLTSRLRVWDYYSAARVDVWIANSQTTSSRIAKYYHQHSDVIYPGADLTKFQPDSHKQPYFATMGSLTPYKKIDMAIAACLELNFNLTVIGDGADMARLKQLAGPTITFAGRVDEATRARLISQAQALIFPNEEDFGIVPIEAMASGTPVIAYGKGGLTETVISGKTGEFFADSSVKSLVALLRKFDASKYQRDDLVGQASIFSETAFKLNIRKFVGAEYAKFRS